MTRMTGPDCAVMCNLINTHTHTQTHTTYFHSDKVQVDEGGHKGHQGMDKMRAKRKSENERINTATSTHHVKC